ncbi:M48 family metallopeptidase [Lacisediminimonas profundi]|uniref:M48 family metallopeptidase n=1 Tax=Lacisediminimonas profundi TaxID=2603856 RepID=UPI00124B70C9|nr:SprT family zinc-dependent metalloprotease [Lacisediminimonas profundi]
MKNQIQIGDLTLEVVRKDIKNIHLSVHPPIGRVTIAAPSHMRLDTLRVFAIAKLSWIRRQQCKLLNQDRERPREFLNRESHYVWGDRYLMTVTEVEAPPCIRLVHKRMFFQTRPGWDSARKQELLDGWYRELIKTAVPEILATWEKKIGVKVNRFFVQRMKTKWGSCNPLAWTIRLNTDLARKPRECLEYIVVHELVHMLEPSHNVRFVGLMDRFMPKWQSHRQLLNSLPVRQESWDY